MKIRGNYNTSKFNYNSGNLNLECIFIRDAGFAANINIIINQDTLTYTILDKHPVSIPVKFGDIYKALEQLNKQLSVQGISIKSCGQCIYFGYSAMSFDMSGGTAGYCQLINGTNVSTAQGDVVGILDLCDAFVFRKEKTETSPWLPS
jgi:hypothetical protein